MVTFDRLLEDYFFSRHLKPRTRISYQGALRQLVIHLKLQGIHLPDEVTQHHILSWRKKALLSMREVSWNCYVRHLRALYNFGIDQGILSITRNPFQKTTLREPKKPKKTLSKEQIRKARAALERLVEFETHGERAVVTPAWFWQIVNETFYFTGLRVNQIVAMQLRDIDLERRVIHARLEGSKTQRAYDIPIAKQLVPWLEKMINDARKLGFKPNDQLFNVNRFSSYHRRKTLNHWQVSAFYRTLSASIGSRISAHRFRHTLCTDLMQSPDRNLHIAMEMLGHTNTKTTLEYVTTDVEMLRESVDAR